MNKSPRRGVEEWRPIIDGQRSSGLTIAAYCRERGITEGTFYTWKSRLRSAMLPAQAKRSPAFVEVRPVNATAAGTIEICLPGDRRLLVRCGFDRDLLIELIRTLEGAA
jgi:transposase-like protein